MDLKNVLLLRVHTKAFQNSVLKQRANGLIVKLAQHGKNKGFWSFASIFSFAPRNVLFKEMTIVKYSVGVSEKLLLEFNIKVYDLL